MIELVIFDMDGTLVPTEQIAARVFTETVIEILELPMSPEEVSRRYRGRDLPHTFADLTELYGAPLPEAFTKTLRDRYYHAIGTELSPSEGVEDAILAIAPISVCVASNGEPETIERTVHDVGLEKYFHGHYFSARQVANPKPAPDLFLHAAAEMGIEPDRSLVVEDTELGVRAALAAGMTAIGYSGNHQDVRELAATGVTVIDHFADLPAIVLHS